MSNLRSRAKGALVEIEHPSGNTIQPQIVGDMTIDRQLNGNPTVSFDVPKNDRWLDDSFIRAEARAYKDGERLPVEEISNVTMSESVTTIELVGGRELRESVKQSYVEQASDIAMENLVQTHTSYTTNIDEITGVEQVVQIWDETTNADLEDSFQAFTNDQPLEIRNGNVETLQTGFVYEAEDNRLSDSVVTDQTDASGNGANSGEGQAIECNTFNQGFDISFNLDYDMPAEEFELAFRIRQSASAVDTPGLQVYVDGNSEYFLPAGSNIVRFGTNYSWFTPSIDLSSDLAEGTHTARLEIPGGETTGRDDAIYLDVVAVTDRRFGHTEDGVVSTNTNGNNYLDSPELYPDSISFTTFTEPTAFNIVGATFAGSFNDVSNNQQIEMSNDAGDTYNISASNTQDASGSFPDFGGSITARITLGRYDDPDTVETTPATGDAGQQLEDFALSIDVNSRPLLLNKSYDENLIDILTDIATNSDYVFELTWDETNSTIQFESTRPGLRTSSANPPIESFTFEKRQGTLIRRAEISGASDSVREKNFIANHGTPVTLENNNLIEAGETVFDADTGTEYDIGEDYQMDYQSGEITTLTGGDLSDGTEYQISYRYKFFGTYQDDSVPTDYDTFVETAPGLTTDRACSQVAVFLVDNASIPVNVADVTIPTNSFEFSLLDSLSLDQIPDADNTFEVWDYQNSPGEATLRLGSRDEINDLFNDITSRLRDTTKQI